MAINRWPSGVMTAQFPDEPLPVVFGTDVATYSFVRLFHEAFGVKSLVIAPSPRGPINDSNILERRFVSDLEVHTQETFVELCHRLGAMYPTRRLILLSNLDDVNAYAIATRAELEPQWFLPYSSLDVMSLVNNKDAMAQVVASVGGAAPKKVRVLLDDEATWEEAFQILSFPIVVKPEDGGISYGKFARGLRKVMPINTVHQARETWSRWAEAGITDPLIIQPLIPGDDTTQWVVNGYVDRRGVITASGSGRVLLGIHEPKFLGNAGLILVTRNESLIEQAHQIVLAAGIRGFFSMDVKIDSRDGTPYWLDLNPRIGRGHYYLKAGGLSLAKVMVADMAGQNTEYSTTTKESIFAIIPSFFANRHYIRDPQLMAHVKAARKEGGVVYPLAYDRERNIKRIFYRWANGLRHIQAMCKFYPRPTETGF